MTDANDLTWSELALLISCRLLGITKHSETFINDQISLVQKLNMSADAKKACIETLEKIERC